MEGKHTSKKATVIRSVYFYLTSLVTLGIVVGSVIFLFNLGLKSWVFTEAESVYTRIGPPTTLFLDDNIGRELTKLETLNCEEECTLTESNKNDIKLWGNNYESWKESKNNPYSNRYNDLAAALSFLIIALPFFIIHYRIVQKDAKKDEEDEDRKVIRPTYYYFISLASLIMVVIAGGMLINLALKVWVFPTASLENDRYIETPFIAKEFNEKTPVQSIVDCGESCGLDDDTVILAEQWLVDYDEWETLNLDGKVGYNNNQRDAASSIPFIIAGIPLFWYHWNIARSRKKMNIDEKEEDNIK